MDVEANIIVGNTISVKVDEYLPDIILVSFKFKDKIFQGILLDSTKRPLPCGVYSKNLPSSDDDPLIDKLFSLKQRHTYLPNNDTEQNKFQNHSPKKTKLGTKQKNARMTVRLRPRQVLCSNCQAICNEKSEKVGFSKLGKMTQVSNSNKLLCHADALPNQNSNTPTTTINSHTVMTTAVSNTTINNLSLSNDPNSLNQNNYNNRKCRDTRFARETRQINQCNSVSSNPKEINDKTQTSQTINSVLVPKLVKLKASDIETATTAGISSLPNDNITSKAIQTQAILSYCTYSESEENIDIEGRLPRLKLIPGSTLKKSRGKIPKMTISTNSLPNGEAKDCGIRTRSRGSFEDKGEEPTAVKMASSTCHLAIETLVERKESDATKVKKVNDSTKKLEEEVENSSKFSPSLSSQVESTEGFSQPLTKLTILPLTSKTVESSDKMNLRKKRSIGSMEDLWDETVFDENKKLKTSEEIKDTTTLSSEEVDSNTDSDKPRTTPILKISFGPGKGTVLKIPAKSTVSENDSTESEAQAEVSKKNKNIITKAARKALKRAKKEAQKKALISVPASSMLLSHKSKFGGKSPVRLGGMSPARLSGFSPGRFGGASPGRFGGTSPGRFGGASPGRFGGASPGRFGGASPGRFGGGSPGRFGGSSPIFSGMMSPRASMESFLRSQSRKHKHKVKHKKKRKQDRKHKSDENAEPGNSPSEVGTPKEDSGPLTEMTNMDISTEKTAVDCIWKVPNSPDQLLTDSSVNAASPSRQNIFQNTRHKLSISIKRVSKASYVACDPSDPATKDDLSPCDDLGTANHPDLSQLPDSKCDTNSSSSPQPTDYINNTTSVTSTNTKASCEESNVNFLKVTSETEIVNDQNQSSDEVSDIPDFPCIATGCMEQGEEDAALLFMNFGWHDVDSCEVTEGLLKVGDIVWGKIDDLPWWPAKVTHLKIKDSCKVHAQVCWYGSSVSSLLPTESLQPFLKKFHVRYKKRNMGAYQDAVREANFDADRLLHETDHPLNLCESPITASPREVDVVS